MPSPGKHGFQEMSSDMADVLVDVDQGDDSSGRPVKRRRRARTSCLPCQRRKTKCDKTDPCEACTKRGEAKLCVWDVPEMMGRVPDDVADKFGALYRRMTVLEKRVSTLEGGKGNLGASTSKAMGSSMSQSDKAESTSPMANFPLPLPAMPGMMPVIQGAITPNAPDEETEEAAQALEDLALGRKQYLAHGLNYPAPTVGTLQNAQAADKATGEQPVAVPQPGAYTTILLGPQAVKSSSIFVAGDRQERAALLEHLPAQEVSDTLVEYFFRDLGWVYNVLHRPTFTAECRELFQCVSAGIDRIDPAWLACYYAVLAWSISAIDPRHANPAAHYSADEVKSLPDIWLRACRRALAAADWASRPQARAIQAILIMISFNRVSTAESGNHFFFVYLSIAARLTQLLGLHKLSKDPTRMPRPDPAWPEQPCALRRELAKRIFYFVLCFDAMWCSAVGISQISMNSFDTDPPLNVDDDDLGLNLLVMERPATELTDTIFAQVHWTLARFQSMAAQLQHQLGNKLDYAAVLQLSTGLQDEITRYERLQEKPSGPDHHRRAIVLLPLHNRMLRLHRPFFMRGWSDPHYEPSSTACLQNAFSIAACLETLSEANLHCFWWLFAHGLGAVTVLSMSLLRKQHLGLETQSAPERSVILSVRRFFEGSSSSHMASATVHPTAKQALVIIDRILAATDPHDASPESSSGASTRTPVAATLRAIAASVTSNGGSNGINGAGHPSTDDFTATARALLSDSMIFGGDADDPTLGSAAQTTANGGAAGDTFAFTWSGAASPVAMPGVDAPVPGGFDAMATQRALYGFASDFSPAVDPMGLPDWNTLSAAVSS